jgi:hypothetical protein
VDFTQDAFVLTCFNKHMKIMPELWAVWMRVMHRAPNAVLWLLRFPKDSEGNLKAAAAAAGVDPTRLVFSDFVMTSDENFERLHAADLVLDTTVYGAHTGAADALWAGKPLLTCIGASPPATRSRRPVCEPSVSQAPGATPTPAPESTSARGRDGMSALQQLRGCVCAAPQDPNARQWWTLSRHRREHTRATWRRTA